MAAVAGHARKAPDGAGTLADRVTAMLVQRISSGQLPVDAHLPSEASLAEQLGVSRTVVREAVSRLKSDGLVEARRGSGTIVLGPNAASPFRIAVDRESSAQQVLRIMELRRGIEGEMAALAAERRTPAQNARIQRALQRIDHAVLDGGDGVSEDLAFHRAIGDASGNPLFPSLLHFLGQFLHAAIRMGRANDARRTDLMRQADREHEAIARAIAKRDPGAARSAALQHLENAAARIRAAQKTRSGTVIGAAKRRAPRAPRRS